MAKRSRAHVIGEIAQRHVELLASEASCTPLAVGQGSDYGIDLPVLTFAATGEQEPGHLLLQIRAAERLRPLKRTGELSVSVKREAIIQWLDEPMPVILVRYDVQAKSAYWLYVQRYFEQLRAFDRAIMPLNMTLRVPPQQTLSAASFYTFAEFKRAIILQVAKVIRHA